MKAVEFLKLIAGKEFAASMTKGQEEVINAIERGDLKVIGVDYGKPGGDRTAKIYGTYDEKKCQFIIDDIELR